MSSARLWIAATAAMATMISSAIAGELAPPGAPAPTPGLEPRTPISALPVTIEESGSYYLTQSLTAPAIFGDGIVIVASDVTIDLNGFTLIGRPGNFTGSAITVDQIQGPFSNIIVHSGIIRDWVDGGINLTQSVGQSRIEDVQVFDCGGDGIYAGNSCIVRRCSVFDCEGDGINLNIASIVEDCVASRNGQWGIRASADAIVRGCTARANGMAGFQVTGLLEGCAANDNAGRGFSLGRASMIFDSSAEGNDIGIACNETTIQRCRITNSLSTGIDAGSRSMIRETTVVSQPDGGSELGIDADGDCDIRNSIVEGHTAGTGIVARGESNRIQGNFLIDNATSIALEQQRNVVVQNRFTRWTQNQIITGSFVTNIVAGPLSVSGQGLPGNEYANHLLEEAE